ncbi:MAG: type II toxin-antitoxin system VapC family toxin [Coriobacteriia bacterium]|nr:type II toxin-antitoxin system VapC family toxin [Coriobacteriia bacterium]
MRSAVFDASVLVKMVVDEPGSPDAYQSYDETDAPIAPDWILIECSNALLRKVRYGEWDPDEARRAFTALSCIDILLKRSEPLMPLAFELALRAGHSPYDCLYLALALAEDANLVTADARLRDLALAAAVDVRWVGGD